MPWNDTARIEHSRDAKRYPSDLIDREWALIAPLLPPARRGGRPRTTDLRAVTDPPAAMRLQAMRLPDTTHRAGADARRLGHRIGGPVGRLSRRIAERQPHDALGDVGSERRDARRPGLVAQQPVDALGHEALLPAPDRGLGDTRLAHDRHRADAIGGQQRDPTSPDMLLSGVTVTDHRLQAAAIGRRDDDENPGAHAPDSHAPIAEGIPKWNLPLGRDH